MTDGGAGRPSDADLPGLWILSDDPRIAEQVARAMHGSGTQVLRLERFPDPGGGGESIYPDWLIADLGSKCLRAADLESFKREHPESQLFLIAGDPRSPVPSELARLGVRHWFLRPLDLDAVRRVLRAALRSRKAEIARLRTRSREHPTFDDLIGRDPAFLRACELARRAAGSPSTVILLEGETGTGKGVFARAIHRESPRAGGPFVEVNCASLPGGLLESELFGHERGAFTHAQTAKPGLLELADSGTFFLDEVAETDPQVQAKILKFLDSGTFRRVGGIEEREVDVRVLAATQKDLERESNEGRFRLDLFHRLHVIRVRIPPLRERRKDVRLLLGHYLAQFAGRLGKGAIAWGEDALKLLEAHSWPGNTRELVNLCERVALLSPGPGEIRPGDLPELAGAMRAVRIERSKRGLQVAIPEGVGFDAIERAILLHAIERAGGNVSGAASALMMGRGQLRYRMERLGISPDELTTAGGRRRGAGPRRGARKASAE